MSARTPEELVDRIIESVNAGDLDGTLALYEPDATFATAPGEAVTGTDAIRQVLVDYLAQKPTLRGQVLAVYRTGDVALVLGDWTMSGTGPDGPVDTAGRSTDVVRRGADGAWRFLIDNPIGTATD